MDAFAAFEEDGFTVVPDLFDVAIIDRWRQKCLANFAEVTSLIESNEEPFGIGVKHGFKEIVQRHLQRFEMPYGMDDVEFDSVLECEPLMTLVKRILRDDNIHIVNRSCVISESGAEVQGWHSDGPHVSVTEFLPCHCLNVFVPLVDVDRENGPTEFRPGSQRYTNNLAKGMLLAIAQKRNKPVQAPSIGRGSVLLFDYRVLHRGCANNSQNPRPILVFTFAKKWYKDNLNFPARSIASIIREKKKNSCGDPTPKETLEQTGLQVDG